MINIKRTANIFIKRSLRTALNFFKEAVFSEEIAGSPGLLQSMDPRVKTLLLAVLLVTTCLIRNIYLLAAFYAASIVIAFFSAVNMLFFIKRVWFFIPVFTLLIAIPSIFLYGLYSAAIFVLRVATCVSWVVLVTITTRHSQLLKSLRSFGIPGIFIQTLDMTYRYIFLLIKIFEEMHIGLKSRLIGPFKPKEARHWVGSRIGFLFRRSVKMSEDVYMAMVARGYKGE